MNHKPYRTLTLWTVWASTALAVYLTLYRDTELWAFLEHDPSRITWLIMGLFFLGVVASFILAVIVTKESVRAVQLDKEAREGGLKSIYITSDRRAADRFFHAIKATLERNGEADVEALLHIELASYERTAHTIEVVGNLLITLGLIGTVMGLTLTLTGLTGSLDALGHDQEMLLAGLRRAMSGMGTAFYTTLLGAVLGGVLLRMFAQITLHGVEGLNDRLMRICMVYCSADYTHSMERDVRQLNEEMQALEVNIKNLDQVFSHSRAVMSAFREEVKRLNGYEDGTKGEEPLHILLDRHKDHVDTLRKQMQILASTRKPFWIRIIELFKSHK
ncbi:MotA/TolQ/ExbB proton channel family protein [Pseudomonadota bacterium]